MDEFLQFMQSFYRVSGIDLRLYKRPQMERRLTSLRNRHRFSDFTSYMTALQTNPDLMNELLDKMTINVSEFFRNMDRWESLLPHLHELSQSGRLKAWSAACSTGEEPYSLSIFMENEIKKPYEILATDLDKSVLQRAQAGIYGEHQIKGVPEKYLDRFFTKEGKTWRVCELVKKHVTFKMHNLLSDPYPNGLDLIICRNVMIYFTDEAKQQVITSFAEALKPGGLLFVGSTEQFLQSEQLELTPVAPFLYIKGKVRGYISKDK